MSAQLRRSSRRKRPTPIAAAAAARKKVRTPDVVATVAESVNAETLQPHQGLWYLALMLSIGCHKLFLIFEEILCQVIAYATI